ncbi:hypothetical protein [Sinorhizobium sp. BG8]|uniref:hypothetical protein n=1 Tax=Sinorhizobium sp. BG8 TaxID=2613773 RepID=UPI00193E4A58|nr:hypothetical protein [Sinorhizobium sp. BG8]QRM55157.1 hypothetical protein F3Y30_11885 [Sinorhizobium sp. BG8]
MKYSPPYGSSDPNAAYVDRNTAGAQSGSRVPAMAVEAAQREIVAVITDAGLTPDSADMTQLLQAIALKIAAATGGGAVENYLLMTQARARLPIFPEVLTSDGRLPVVSPSTGQIRVPAGYEFLHRGIFSVTTVQADFATAGNKTYHLRWSPTAGFALKDVSDLTYNSSSLAESSATFDSKYDDMLVSRVVTSSGNIPTITNLVNVARVIEEMTASGTITTLPYSNASEGSASIVYNLARTPKISVTPREINTGANEGGSFPSSSSHDHDFFLQTTAKTRYGATFRMLRDFSLNDFALNVVVFA